MIRTFVAIELDATLRRALADAQESLKRELARALRGSRHARVQWVKPDAIHLTLKFLGDIEEAQVQPIGTALGSVAARYERYAMLVGGYGVFPDLRAPRVLWTGVRDQQDAVVLSRLAADVDEALGTLGFEREHRPFSPHLTLARIKDGGREVGRALTELGVLAAPSTLGTLEVPALALMRSQLHPTGSIYTRLVDVPLR